MPELTLNPESTARAEYEFWRAHDDKDPSRLRSALERWTGELYGLEPDVSAEAVGHLFGAVAAHDTREWDAAVEHAARYYAVIEKHSGLSFDPRQAGELEVAWWRIHDELEHEADKGPLVDAFSRLYAEVFGAPVDAVRQACELKAQATVEHDRAEDDGVDPEQAERHWHAAAECLRSSYTALQRNLN